jgi:hypothetical protein
VKGHEHRALASTVVNEALYLRIPVGKRSIWEKISLSLFPFTTALNPLYEYKYNYFIVNKVKIDFNVIDYLSNNESRLKNN